MARTSVGVGGVWCGGGGGTAQCPSATALRRVFEAARLFVGCRDGEAAMAAGHIPPARTLAEAIQRDFLGFDLERAERALREAVIAADPDTAPIRLLFPDQTPVADALPEPPARPGGAKRRGRRRSGVSD